MTGPGQQNWSDDDLTTIGNAEELQVSSVRPDGALRPYVTIWVVRVGPDLYVRSAYGPGNGWFRRAVTQRTGQIRAGGLERGVTFADPDPGVHADLDAAYHAKYDRYGAAIVNTVVGEQAEGVTLRLVPAAD